MGVFGQKRPKLADPEFSQYVHDVIPVEDPKYSFYNKIREKERVVWEKSSNRVFFGQQLQKIGQKRTKVKNENFRAKTEMPQFDPTWIPNFMQEIRKIERAVLAAYFGRTDVRE